MAYSYNLFAQEKQFEASWALQDKRKVPEWFIDAKFGIFIHCGVYSVPAWTPAVISFGKNFVQKISEGYWPRLMHSRDQYFRSHHEKMFGKGLKYQDFAPKFKAEWLSFKPAKGLLDKNYDFGTKVNYHFFKIFNEPVNNSNRFVKVNFNNVLNYSGIGKHTGSFKDVEGGVFYNSGDTDKGYLMLFNKWGNTCKINRSSLEEILSGTITEYTKLSPNKTIKLEDALVSEVDFSQTMITLNDENHSILPYSGYSDTI